MASSDFTIEGTAVPAEVETTQGATINLALVSTSGVKTITWSIQSSSDDDVAVPTITPAGIPLGATATYTFPSEPVFAHRIRCVTNAGMADESTSEGIVGTPSAAGLIPLTVDEELSRDATMGWTRLINNLIVAVGGGSLTADTGDTEVNVPNNSITTLLSLDPDNLAGIGAWGATGSQGSGWIDFYVSDLNSSSGGNEVHCHVRRFVERYSGGSMAFVGDPVLISERAFDHTLTFTDGAPALFRITKSANYDSTLKVRASGFMHTRSLGDP